MDNNTSARVNWWRLLGWVVAVLALLYLVRWLWQVDKSVWLSLRHLRIWWLVGALAVFQLWFLLRFAAWEFIVRRYGVESQRHVTLRNWTVSELMRYAPGNVWSFASKYRTSVTSGASGAGAIKALVIEAWSQVLGAALVAILFFYIHQLWWLALAIVAVFPYSTPIILRLVEKWKKLATDQTISITESLGLLLWYGLVWMVFGIATAMVYLSFPDVPAVTMSWLIGINVMSWLIGYLSVITPMGLGVREVTFVKLSAVHLTQSIASLVSLVTRLWFILSELVFLTLVVIWSSRRK